jgi:bis(5'-nucleosyl)-tetraphosphatase (symmetrical)
MHAPPAPGRTIVVGDVHGCLAELLALVEEARWRPGVDRLILLGDLLDRGPDTVATVQWARRSGVECLLGNHEEKHLRWALHEARRRDDPRHVNPVRMAPGAIADHARLTPEDLGWLAALPRTAVLGGAWVAVHGGLLPGRPLALQPPDWLIRLRYLDAGGKPVSRHRGERGDPGVRRWPEAWRGPYSVVYGHHARAEVAVDACGEGVRCVGIDTGCVYGGKLTAFVLPKGELVQIDRRKS